MVERDEDAADEAHVVVERQPAHTVRADVSPGLDEAGAHRTHIGEQVGVRERDRLGIDDGARGELHHRDVARTRRVDHGRSDDLANVDAAELGLRATNRVIQRAPGSLLGDHEADARGRQHAALR